MRWALIGLTAAAAFAAEDFVVFREPGSTTREQLARHLNAIAFRKLEARAKQVASIRTREEAEARKKQVREKLLRLIGGLPETRGPLNVKPFGTVDRGEYRIEKIVYDSLPGFHVTADVYVPAHGTPPFPAILMPVGHGRDGKGGSQQVAVGLALKGFIALAYDPIGQGERLQYYDPDLGASKVGGPTDEHSHANGQTMLIGHNVARYRIWDGMRGIDYLESRADVDRNRIGCTGCSGGGTLTTYISALDDRVKAAAPACYVTSWRELLAALGPQDGEQSFPGFVGEGLDIADYIELFAPKPWLMVNTIQDFFPLEGARQTYEEARRWYRLYGAEERMGWHIGPGGHGWPQPSREAIYGWFIRWLKDGKGDASEPAFKLNEPDALLVTSTGQVADSLGGETVFTLNRKRALDLIPRAFGPPAPAVRELAAIAAQPGAAPPRLTVHRTVMRAGYRVEVASFESEPGLHVPALIAVPDGGGTHPAVLLADPRPRAQVAAESGDFDALAQSGRVVMAVAPRGISETGAPAARGSLLGDYNAAMRAAVIGKTLPGMRAEDLMRAVDALLARPEVKKDGVSAVAQGPLGVPLLFAALLDKRIREVVVENTLASYRMAADRPVTRGLYDVAVPGALRRFDLDAVAASLAPAAVTILNPVDAAGNPVKLEPLRKRLGDRVRVEYRGRRDPLAVWLQAGI